MRSGPLIISLILAVAFLICGCLEPGDTPLGPEDYDDLDITLPGPPVAVSFSGASLGLELPPQYWDDEYDDPLPLFDSNILTCGFDEVSGFLCQPIIQFSMTGNLAEASGLDLLKVQLRLHLPFHDPTQPHNGDNPDLEKDIRARLWHLGNMVDENPEEPYDEIELGPLDMEAMAMAEEAWQIPLLDGDGGPAIFEPFRLELVNEYFLPPDSVEAWIASGETVTLLLDWAGTDGGGETGYINIYSRRSVALDSGDEDEEDLTAAQLSVFPNDDDPNIGVTGDCVQDGMLASREDPGIDTAAKLLLTTGLHNAVQIRFTPSGAAWDSLFDPANMIVKAVLSLYPDTLGFYNLSARDYKDNLSSTGLFYPEGGLTLDVQMAENEVLSDPDDEEGEFLDNFLAIAKTDYFDDDDYSDAKSPLILPVLSWLQDVVEGNLDNNGLLLKLNGSDNRCRQLLYELDPTDTNLAPRLDVIYVRRPDFD